jgi:hypothetical protein
MDNFNVVNTLDTNDENSNSSEDNNLNTMLNNLCIYDENVISNVMICSGITIAYILFFSVLFILFVYLSYLF